MLKRYIGDFRIGIAFFQDRFGQPATSRSSKLRGLPRR